MKCTINIDELPTLESLLNQIEAITEGALSFEIFIPRRLSFHRRIVFGEFPEGVVIDRLLHKGMAPVTVEHKEDGQILQFERAKKSSTLAPRTEPPPIDITQKIPALTGLWKTTIRLHPRRAMVSEPAASKLGGTFLWPSSEPWPRCDDQRHQTGISGRRSATDGISPTLVGVIQLNRKDFPEIAFRPGSDLLQLLWCPTTEQVHDDDFLFPKLFWFWRDSQRVVKPITEHPLPDFIEPINNHFPVACQFLPERMLELPGLAALSKLPNYHEIHKALSGDEKLWIQFQDDLCACPSMKFGGHPNWIQNDDTPICHCGARMDFLLQLCDWEYTNMDHTRRWIPVDDRWAVDDWRSNPAAEAILRPSHLDFAGEVYYIFVCRQCSDWPLKLVDQR